MPAAPSRLPSAPRYLTQALLAIASLSIAAPATAQTTLFSDSFNRTTGLGSNWYLAFGSYATDGTYAISGSPIINGNWAAVTQNLGTDDYSVAADINIPPGSMGSGLVARSNDPASLASTLYALYLNTDGTIASAAVRN